MMTGRVQVARAVVWLYHLSYWPAWWASEESNLDLAFYRSMYARAVRARFRSMVDLAGLEPATFCMPCRRAPTCATSPVWCPWLDLNQQPPRCERDALPLRYKGVEPMIGIEPISAVYKTAA